jgi:nitroimidazol reductase NimA-like FMN-containing flavoprotein (pyridoxamine 5'-phosphate oxidase superfamily)
MTIEEKSILDEMIDTNFIMTLGTIVDDNPHLCTVFYVTDDNLNLYFKSRTESEHIEALPNSNYVAGSIYLPESNYANRKGGVQLLGTVGRVTNIKEMTKVLGMYTQAFAGSEKKFDSIPEMITDSVKSTMFRFKVEKAKVLDSDLKIHSTEYFEVE